MKKYAIAIVFLLWLGVLVLAQRGRYDFSEPGTFDSIRIGNFTLQQDNVDNDGLEIAGAIHSATVGGVAGNFCLHDGNEPTQSNSATGSRLWSDPNGVLKHQKSTNAGGGSVAIATGSGDLSDYLKKDGSVPLTSDWDIGDTYKILSDEIRARDIAGLKLYDDGEKGIFVKDGGNVGIGTTEPNELLHLKTAGGNSLQYALKMQNPYGSTSEGSTGMLFQVATSGGTSEKGGIVFERKNTYGRGNFHFLLNNDANSASATLNDAKMTITRGGGIGFGTSPDSAWFHIKQDGSGIGFVRLEDTQTDGQTFWINNGNGSAGGVGKAGFYYGGSQRMSFEASSGNVGIGTTAPAEKLDVDGNIKLTGNIYPQATDTYTLGTSGSRWDNIYLNKTMNVIDDFYIYDATRSRFSIQADGTYLFSLDSASFAGSKSDGFMIKGNAYPMTDNTYDLGTSSLRWDDVWATNGTIQTSDKRRKKDITDLKYGIDEINQLRPISFKWKKSKDNRTKLGLITQEIVDILPEVVYGSEEESYGINYGDLVPILIKAIQEQQKQIDELTKRIERLEN